MRIQKVVFTLVTILAFIIIYPSIFASKLIVTSLDHLTSAEVQNLSVYDPTLGGYRPLGLPVANPTELQVVNKTYSIQSVILSPLQVENGPQFVRPEELFKIRVILRNKDNIAYTIAIFKKPTPSVVDYITNAISWITNALLGLVGYQPKQQTSGTVNKTLEIVPIYYLIAAVDPQAIQTYAYSPTTQKIIYPGGAYQLEPGYGCYDIVLGNELQMAQAMKAIHNGTITLNDLMCGQIAGPNSPEAILPNMVNIKSKFGPLTVVLPVQVYAQSGDVGKAVITYKNGKVIGIVQGCTDRGDGQPYTQTVTVGGSTYKVYIPSKPHDCILTPGESMEFDVYGLVNPLPSGELPPQAAGQVISTLYSQPEKAEELMSKYPGAIHEIYFFLGKINDVSVGITLDDITHTIGSILLLVGGGLAGFYTLGAIGGIAGTAVGAFVNYLATGSWLDLTLFKKAAECVYSGKCIYTIHSLLTVKTYLVIVQPQFQVTLYLVHLGMVIFMVLAGSYVGYKLAS